jgi:hypothetical protein
MKEYKYEGETFQIDDSGGCEVKVSDGENTAVVTLNSGNSVYRVSVGGGAWATNTPEASVQRACRQLIAFRNAPSTEDACKALSGFVESL